jgi:hypothetical protein
LFNRDGSFANVRACANLLDLATAIVVAFSGLRGRMFQLFDERRIQVAPALAASLTTGDIPDNRRPQELIAGNA